MPAIAPPDHPTRPSATEILARWKAYFADPLLSLAALRGEAEQGTLHGRRGLRSLSWRFFFGVLPAPTPLPARELYAARLDADRQAYAALRERFLRSPDGRWVADGAGAVARSSGGGDEGPARVEDVRVNNPLGLDEENPWTGWFADMELRREIRKDVLRTFPEVEYFRTDEAQDRMTDLLFIWCKLAPEIGYRQGMHELLAPLLWIVDYDSLPPPSDQDAEDTADDLARLVLARDWVEHDTWALFSAVMHAAKPFYDHTSSVALTPRSAHTFHPSSATATTPAQPTTLVQPIVALSARLQALLGTLDTPLARAFAELQVEPQLYSIRWFRLLFSREFPLAATLTLWDALFAADPSLALTSHIALALLLRSRDALLGAAHAADYGAFLQLLLRPASDTARRTELLVQQAVYLRDHASAEGAAHVRAQNAALGVAIGKPFPPALEDGVDAAPARAMHRRAQTVAPPNGLGFFGGEGLVGDLAKGVLARGEALGINKALRGTLDEIKRGVAEAQTLAEERRRAAARVSPNSLSGFSQIPTRAPWVASPSSSATSTSGSERPRPSSPPPPPTAAKDALADLEAMRRASAGMSAAVSRAVEILERVLGAERARDGDVRGALDALRHVGDVLGGRAEGFDPRAARGGEPGAPPRVVVPQVGQNTPAAVSAPSAAPRTPTLPAPHAPPAHDRAPTSLATSAPALYLGGRTDKPLPSLTRTPQPRPSPPAPSLREAESASTYPPASAVPSYPPLPSSRAATPAALPASPPPPSAASFPPSTFSTRPRPPHDPIVAGTATADPLGVLSPS